jgi:phosphopantetheine--protein transferase-like protein
VVYVIHGVGTDILAFKRLLPLASDFEDPFFTRTFTEAERGEAKERQDPLKFYAGRFSAKEAVFKALRVSSDAVRLNEIEILSDKHGAPCARLLGRAAELGAACGIRRIYVSISYEEDCAVSFAACET